MKTVHLSKITLLLVLMLSDTFFSNEITAQQKMIGPYLQKMSDDEVTISWSTYEGVTEIKNSDKVIQEVGQYQQHQSIITRLEPNTTYTYDVLKDGTDRGKGSFTTFPEEAEPFTFVALGDTRSRHDVHQKIVNRIIKEDPLFVVNTGDLVARGNNMSDWEHFFEINDRLIRHTPYYTVLGNHEQNSDNYFNFFSLPGNESYYFFTVGDALFVVLDMDGEDINTPAYLKDENEDEFWQNISRDYFVKEKKWLENVLTLNKDAGYIFVFFHPTFYSIKSSRVAEAKLRREFWGDIFERHQVTAVLNGHDHYYHHARHGGVDYIVTAGGGAPIYETDAPQPETIKYKGIEHYMRIDVKKKHTILKAIDIHGNLIEEIKVKRRN